MRSGELPASSLTFARSGCATSISPTAFASPRRTAPRSSAIPLSRLGPSERRRSLLDHLVPRPRESALPALLRERPLAVPLAAGLLVVHLEAVAVRIRKKDADGYGLVRDGDGDVLGLQPLIHLGEVFEAPHPPRDMVQAHLLLLRPGSVLAHLEERDVVGVIRVTRQEGGPQLTRCRKGHGVLGVQPEDIRVPLVRPLGVAH